MVFNGESAFLVDVVDQIFITSEETGEISLNSIDRGSISRVAMVGQILLQSMMIDNNIVGN